MFFFSLHSQIIFRHALLQNMCGRLKLNEMHEVIFKKMKIKLRVFPQALLLISVRLKGRNHCKR